MSNIYAETPHRFFDGLLTRKPSDWSDCSSVAVLSLPEPVREWLSTLPKYRFVSDYRPICYFPEGASIYHIRRFIAEVGGKHYLVSTEGYGYCRYALRLTVV